MVDYHIIPLEMQVTGNPHFEIFMGFCYEVPIRLAFSIRKVGQLMLRIKNVTPNLNTKLFNKTKTKLVTHIYPFHMLSRMITSKLV